MLQLTLCNKILFLPHSYSPCWIWKTLNGLSPPTRKSQRMQKTPNRPARCRSEPRSCQLSTGAGRRTAPSCSPSWRSPTKSWRLLYLVWTNTKTFRRTCLNRLEHKIKYCKMYNWTSLIQSHQDHVKYIKILRLRITELWSSIFRPYY